MPQCGAWRGAGSYSFEALQEGRKWGGTASLPPEQREGAAYPRLSGPLLVGMQPRRTGSGCVSALVTCSMCLMGLCPPCSLIAWGTHLPIKLPLRTLSFSALNPLAWVPSQVDSPWGRLLWEMNDCPPLQKTLGAHPVGLPPLCKGQKTTDPPETSLLAKGRGGHFPVLTALMVGALSTAPRQTRAASATLHPRGPLQPSTSLLA